MSARVIKNETLDFKKELRQIKENLSFRLFLSLSLGSLFLMGCEEKLAQEPEQAPPIVADTMTAAERDGLEDRADLNKAEDRALQDRLNTDNNKTELALAGIKADTARVEADSEAARALAEANARVAAAQVAADGATNQAMMGGALNLVGLGFQGYIQGLAQKEIAEANLRAAEAQQVAARMRAENEARGLELQAELSWAQLGLLNGNMLNARDYLCGTGDGAATKGPCGSEANSWKSKIEAAAVEFKREYEQATADFRNAGDDAARGAAQEDAEAAVETFKRSVNEANDSLDQLFSPLKEMAERSIAAVEQFGRSMANGESPSTDLKSMIQAHMKKHNDEVQAQIRGQASATRDTGGVDENFHAALRDSTSGQVDTAEFR